MNDKTDVVRGLCRGCGHVWPVVYLPMELSTAARIMARALCPKCGSKEVLVAQPEDEGG